jgi:hypothetical protein
MVDFAGSPVADPVRRTPTFGDARADIALPAFCFSGAQPFGLADLTAADSVRANIFRPVCRYR